MLTTIPEEEFLQLCEGVSEANDSKNNFSWAEMLKWSNTRDRINEYMATTNMKYIGAGSSRTAYYLPQKSYGGPNKLNTPACFKVANNVKGIAQNKLEIKTLNTFNSDEWPCFPYLYDWDGKKSLFMLCEVGTNVHKCKIAANYFDDWCSFSKKYCSANGINKLKKKIEYWYGKVLSEKIFNPYDIFSILNFFQDQVDSFSGLKKRKDPDAKKVFECINGFFDALIKQHPKYNGVISTIRFWVEHPKEISPGDFEVSDNWAFVKRDEEYVAIPIDWGLNDKVWTKYYRN